MNNFDWDPLFHEYAVQVINKMQSGELTSTFSEYAQFLSERYHKTPDWQIALPVISCLAAGGSLDDGMILASAWISLYLASEILDHVEDKELILDRF